MKEWDVALCVGGAEVLPESDQNLQWEFWRTDSLREPVLCFSEPGTVARHFSPAFPTQSWLLLPPFDVDVNG